MSELEKQAALAYADLKCLIVGKFLRQIEYHFSNERSKLTFQSKERQELLGSYLTYAESELKNSIKEMEI